MGLAVKKRPNTQEIDWIETCVNGNPQAFQPLVARYQGPVFRIALRILGDRVEAEDAAQDAFLKAFAGLRQYRPEWAFSTWLYRIVVNVCVDRVRRRRLHVEELTEPSVHPEGFRVVHQKQVVRGVQDALTRLPDDYRVALVLKDIEGLDYATMSTILGQPVSALKIRVVRGRAKLAAKLKKMYPDLSALVSHPDT